MNERLPRSILVCGAPGVGKSHLIAASLSELADVTAWNADEIITHTHSQSQEAHEFERLVDPRARCYQLLACGFEARLSCARYAP